MKTGRQLNHVILGIFIASAAFAEGQTVDSRRFRISGFGDAKLSPAWGRKGS